MNTQTPLSRLISALPNSTTFGGGPPISEIDHLLTGGSPAPEALPAEAIAAAAAAVLARPDARTVSLNYSEAHGNLRLRSWLAAREGVDPRRIVIVNGALHGISLVVRALLDPGDLVVVEDPTFVVAHRTLQYSQAQVLRIPVRGFVARLREALAGGLRPRLVYTIPDFQNPTGLVLGAEERRELVALAERYGFVLLWDNPYRASRLRGEAQPDVRIDGDRVAKIDTFSKSLGPGLRLGWLVLPEFLVEPVLNIRRRTDQQAPTFMQAVLAELLSGPGVFDAVLERIRGLHRERLDALVAALRAEAGEALEFETPEGGFFLWARLTAAGTDPAALERAAAAERLLYVAGRQFGESGDGDFSRFLRLGYTNKTPEQLESAAAALGRALRRLRAA